MPRTVESIVENHRRARDLRSRGKPIWTYQVDVRSILHEYKKNDDASLCDVATRIAASLRRKLPSEFFDVTSDRYEMLLDEAVEDLESYTPEGLDMIRKEDIDVIGMFNGRLDELYDWADRNRVWLG